MIIIINGPLGIGKSTTAWALTQRFPRAALLDIDHVAAFHPFDYYKQADLDLAYHGVGTLGQFYAAQGISNLVINWVLESAEQLERLQAALAPCGLPMRSFRLRCDPAELARRVRARNGPDLAFELQRSQELVQILEQAASLGDLGQVIDTTELTVDQSVAQIWAELQKG
jgi:thymidylate kinase